MRAKVFGLTGSWPFWSVKKDSFFISFSLSLTLSLSLHLPSPFPIISCCFDVKYFYCPPSASFGSSDIFHVCQKLKEICLCKIKILVFDLKQQSSCKNLFSVSQTHSHGGVTNFWRPHCNNNLVPVKNISVLFSGISK